MKVQPSYAENIIVLTLYKGTGQWFVSNKEFWYMDLRKLVKAFEDIGYKVPNPNDFSDRFDIDIINHNTVKKFLDEMSEYQVPCEELRGLLIENTSFEVMGLAPSLFIDFDSKNVYSYFPEPASFEKYIPDGWEGQYCDLTLLIPDEFKYWLVGNKNLFKKD